MVKKKESVDKKISKNGQIFTAKMQNSAANLNFSGKKIQLKKVEARKTWKESNSTKLEVVWSEFTAILASFSRKMKHQRRQRKISLKASSKIIEEKSDIFIL